MLVLVLPLLYAAMVPTADPFAAPNWFGAVFAHSGFVGMMTDLLLGVATMVWRLLTSPQNLRRKGRGPPPRG